MTDDILDKTADHILGLVPFLLGMGAAIILSPVRWYDFPLIAVGWLIGTTILTIWRIRQNRRAQA